MPAAEAGQNCGKPPAPGSGSDRAPAIADSRAAASGHPGRPYPRPGIAAGTLPRPLSPRRARAERLAGTDHLPRPRGRRAPAVSRCHAFGPPSPRMHICPGQSRNPVSVTGGVTGSCDDGRDTLHAGTPPTGRPAGPVLPRPERRAVGPGKGSGGRGTKTWRVRPPDGPAAAESPDRPDRPDNSWTTPDNSRRCTCAGRGAAPAGRIRPPDATRKASPAGDRPHGPAARSRTWPRSAGRQSLVAPLADSCSTLHPLHTVRGRAAHPAGRLGVRKQRCSRAAVPAAARGAREQRVKQHAVGAVGYGDALGELNAHPAVARPRRVSPGRRSFGIQIF